MQDAPILEFDSSPTAIIEPSQAVASIEGLPERVVFCFFNEIIQSVCGNGQTEVIGHLGSEIGVNSIYQLEHEGQDICVTHPGVGASLMGTFFEEMIAKGGAKFIACGGAGVLDSAIRLGTVVIPNSAIRDEGTSYHYLPPSREVAGHPQAIEAIKQTLAQHDVPYLIGKTWTTDAPYRETANKVKHRRDEGCLTVEMETSAFFAIAQFRQVVFGQLLYGGDDVGGETWDHRGWHQQASTREKLFWLAVESVLKL